MTTEEHISKVEKDVNDINKKVDTILSLVQKMDVGLYGDEKNKHLGVIEKQSLLEKEIDELKDQIEAIIKKRSEEDIATITKKSFKLEVIDYTKELGKWLIKAIVVYFVLKGTLNPEALLK